mmetsp:Transcript_1753/g.3121  ORF Transcript_1753/g.3121 Transcript_1753/m.3121 type:complete len:232 (-) Transcript_1753:499-1194(-)
MAAIFLHKILCHWRIQHRSQRSAFHDRLHTLFNLCARLPQRCVSKHLHKVIVNGRVTQYHNVPQQSHVCLQHFQTIEEQLSVRAVRQVRHQVRSECSRHKQREYYSSQRQNVHRRQFRSECNRADNQCERKYKVLDVPVDCKEEHFSFAVFLGRAESRCFPAVDCEQQSQNDANTKDKHPNVGCKWTKKREFCPRPLGNCLALGDEQHAQVIITRAEANRIQSAASNCDPV